jgi:hypothetical protein
MYSLNFLAIAMALPNIDLTTSTFKYKAHKENTGISKSAYAKLLKDLHGSNNTAHVYHYVKIDRISQRMETVEYPDFDYLSIITTEGEEYENCISTWSDISFYKLINDRHVDWNIRQPSRNEVIEFNVRKREVGDRLGKLIQNNYINIKVFDGTMLMLTR